MERRGQHSKDCEKRIMLLAINQGEAWLLAGTRGQNTIGGQIPKGKMGIAAKISPKLK